MIPAAEFFNDAYFDSFETPKYQFRGAFHRGLIRRLMGRLAQHLQSLQPKTILDVGGGEGFFTSYLVKSFSDARLTVLDYAPEDLERLRKRLPTVETIQGDAHSFDLGRRFDLVVATEILEHLDRPQAALQQFAAHGDRLVMSVPWEPFFMLGNLARGKNVSRLGNDIEHVNHWYPGSFKRFLSREIVVDSVAPSFPWITAAGHKK